MTCCVPLALLPGTRRDILANRIAIRGPKTELLSCPITRHIERELVEYDIVAIADYAALCVATSVIAAIADADNPNLGRI